MRSKTISTVLKTGLFVGLLISAGTSSAAEYYLKAQSFDKQIPDGVGGTIPVKMWGFADCGSDVTFTTCTAPDAPGLQLDETTGGTLTIHLMNDLQNNMPVSIMIPGQAGGGNPDSTTLGRIGSFTQEVAPGTDGTYSWSSLRAGTYLYQSASYPSLEVPMGLYGALVVKEAGGDAYPGVASDVETVLLFSEVDPIQNQRTDNAAAAGGPTLDCDAIEDFALDPGTYDGFPCTIDYNPALFLVNGQATADDLPAGNGTAIQSVLLRMLNAGSRSHTPSIVNVEMDLVAEDGNPYPGAMRKQNAVLLAAGKTIDALITVPADDITLPLFDRMPTFSNENLPSGGSLVTFQVGAGSPPATPPTLNEFSFDVAEDSTDNLIDPPGGTGTRLVSSTSHGALVESNPSGSFLYTPNPDFSGTDTFTYYTAGPQDTWLVTINVIGANDAPVAGPDGPYVNTSGTVIVVDAAHGLLGNDADPDGDTLTAVVDGITPPGLILIPDGSFTYTGAVATTFDYVANDGAENSNSVTVSLEFNDISNIALTVHEPEGAAVTDYRWVIQENRTYIIDPENPLPVPETLSTNFHKSSMPVVAEGVGAAEFSQLALDPDQYYYVSVLPADAGSGAGHTMGGAELRPGMSAVDVVVNPQPIPTAQLSVFVFEDNLPTNGVPDPLEVGLGGYQIILEDAGGRYGMSGGTMSQDAFGAPLRNALDCFGGAEPPVGVILSCPDGSVLVKDLPPAKYGIVAVPKGADSAKWKQTSTIEGTKVIDAWVKANEPPFFAEFGVASFHAFFGFVNPEKVNMEAPGGDNTVAGRVTMQHPARPPVAALDDSNSYAGLAHTRAWVGINSDAGGGPNIQTVQADEDGFFSLSNVPDGTHQIVVWDAYLDQIMSYRTVIVDGGSVDVGNIPVPTWFGRQEHQVFLDLDQDGVLDPGEEPLPEQAVNLRWRDGTVFQSFPTDTEGFVPFDQIFPFGSWLVAEVDYTRFKATGVTITVDGGGDVTGGPYPGLLNPQAGSPYTLPPLTLTAAYNSLAGMTSLFEWGKAPYAKGENGGISGIVFYGSTRGEEDPRLTVGDPWEAGIASVKVRLYKEVERQDGSTALALVEEVETDSWDADTPTECPGETAAEFINTSLGGDAERCFDGVRNWEQVRPGVFDGGYAFNDIPAGKYIVEVVPPQGYQVIKEEDVNVGFGDSFGFAPVAVALPSGAMLLAIPDAAMVAAALAPEPGLAQPPCVGDERMVDPYLSLFPSEMIEAPFAGALRPLCNRKEVILSDQGQAAADFHLFTYTPVAGQFQGLTTDDIAIETNPASPSFGDKWGPAFMPISMRDFNGQEIYRTYSDAFGRYNGMLTSTFSANLPIPSGYSPAMHLVCLNDPVKPDGTMDPLRNPNYGTFCYTLQYMPHTTTYLDTPLIPQAAFAAGFNSVDCACTDGTPKIVEVRPNSGGPSNFGPWIDSTANGAGHRDLVIRSAGTVEVANPDYEGPLATAPNNQRTVLRDFGFGEDVGTVTIGGVVMTLQGSWDNDEIRVRVPESFTGSGQLVVTRGDNGKVSTNAVTVTRSDETPVRVSAGQSIQDAIDNATPGALILVDEGIYNELVVMWKPVRLQGVGSATVINALRLPTENLETWRQKVKGLIDAGDVDLLPGQPAGEFDLVNGGLFGTEQGAGITVLAKSSGPNRFNINESRIDGFTITGADGGGGVFVNGYAHRLEISNNFVTSNMGNLSGGVRLGHPYLPNLNPSGNNGGIFFNNNISIHNNAITLNGARDNNAVGGGVALNAGSYNYNVSNNFICGNFSIGDGAGIGHLGLSHSGNISGNQVLFNQSFNTESPRSGGGIMVAGEPTAAGMTFGTGDIDVIGNLVQGNQAGSGHGGGIRLQEANGGESDYRPNGNPWRIRVLNNIVVNNVAGWSGGGMSLSDTINARIVNNTIANNDSTATVGTLVAINSSEPQPAGISSQPHSAALATALNEPGGFSDPTLINNILWHNRSFTYDATTGAAQLLPIVTQTSTGQCGAGAAYFDLGVLGGGGQLDPRRSLLTDTSGYHGSNVSGDPDFLAGYCNGARTLSSPGPMQVAAEVIEGGNFIDVRYGPLTQAWPANSGSWDYHIGSQSAGLDNTSGGPATDFDGQPRPQGGGADRGADEFDLTP